MMNRSSILQLSGILAAVAFAFSLFMGAFSTFGGYAFLFRLGLDGRVVSQINSGAHLLISVLLAAAFGILSMDKENLVAGLIGAIRAGICCILSFLGLIGALWVYDDSMFCWPLVRIGLAVMFVLSLVLIKNTVSRRLRVLAMIAAAYMLVSQLVLQGAHIYRLCFGVSLAEMQPIYAVLRFFMVSPVLMCTVVLIVYFIAQACSSNRLQSAFTEASH